MRKITTLLLSLLAVTLTFGKSVTKEQASQVANKYLSATSLKANRSVANSFNKSYNGITTYYVFNYTGGGFVVVSADDAATPILAQSDEGFIEENITNPEMRYWFENYSKEIAQIVEAKLDNTESLAEWNNILNNKIKSPSADVGPLLTTTWDQGSYYNFYCPAFIDGPLGKAYTGCVATAMSQIINYHQFPASGVGSHTYVHPLGTLTADYSATNYDFASMGTTANSMSFNAIATLMFHAGVSVNMGYGTPEGSAAYSGDVPYALTNYFNYDNKTIAMAYMSNHTATEWKAILMSELDASRPVYYSGSDPVAGGHAWVCDGYRSSDGRFHMNWGWSGSGNGYYAIGALSSGNGNFNSGNAIIYGIQPGNPNLIVRFTDLEPNNSVPFGPSFDIKCSVIAGTPNSVNLYIDDKLVFNTSQKTITYPWSTTAAGIGVHKFRVEAIAGTDTVYRNVNIGISEWKSEASGFNATSRGIGYLHAVDSNVVWGTATDGSSYGAVIQEFTKTINGGATWTTGIINNCEGLVPSMIFATSKDTAYAPMFKQTGLKAQGIYVTKNGGSTWARQVTASFKNSASFPNVVGFFNKNDGFCMGDPINGDFEIYTTSDGGTNWTIVPGTNIADPASGEFGVVGYYSIVGNNAWFGTNEGRVYRSIDKGLHWNASATTLGNTTYTDVEFRDALHGLAQDKSTSDGVFSETSDGGITWTAVTSTGDIGISDFCYVPGTENTWVSTGIGASYSFDGGHSWAPFPGTQTDQFLAVDFVNKNCGWAGTYNTDATTKGMYKYAGILDPANALNPATNLTAQNDNGSVQLSWSEPATIPLSYNIYRNDTLISNTTSLIYNDSPVAAGSQNYCVTSVYSLGESPKTCTTTFITLGIQNTSEVTFRIYPNPSSDVINIITPVKFSEVRIINSLGKVVYRNQTKGTNLRILTQGFEPGMYILQIYTGTQVVSKKVSIIR